MSVTNLLNTGSTPGAVRNYADAKEPQRGRDNSARRARNDGDCEYWIMPNYIA